MAAWGGVRPPPAAAALTLLLALGASAPRLLRDAPAARPLRAALGAGEVHRVITHVFVYEDLPSLACGAAVIWRFGGSFERSVGTARHCVLTAAFALLSALLYLPLEAALSRGAGLQDPGGFTPVALAMLGASGARSGVRRTLLCGVPVPVLLLPWLLLGPACCLPRPSPLRDLCGLLAGQAYGLGYCSCLDLPESVASKLDGVFPFSLLKRIPGLKYIPASSAERRAFESSKINPAPGAYPTQSYSCSSPPALPTFQPQHPAAQSPGCQQSCAMGQEGPRQGHAAGHSFSSSSQPAPGASGGHPAGASPGQRPDPQTPVAAGPPGTCCSPAPGAPLSPEFSRVQVD